MKALEVVGILLSVHVVANAAIKYMSPAPLSPQVIVEEIDSCLRALGAPIIVLHPLSGVMRIDCAVEGE